MTISSTPAIVQYQGDGVSVTFTVPYYFQNSTDLVLTKRSSAGVDAVLVIGTDYSVTGAGNTNGGSVTLNIALQTGAPNETLTIVSDPIIQQQTHYLLNGLFPSSDTENALDLLTRIAQVLRRREDRSMRAPDADVNPVMLLPTAAVRGAGQGTFPHFGAGGGNLELVTGISGLSTPLSPSIIGLNLWSQSAGEVAAGVTPVDYSKYYDDPKRFGAVLNGTVDDTAAFVNISAALAAGGGGVVRFIGTPLFNSAIITIPKNVTWEGPQSNPGIDFDTNNTGTYFKSGTIVLNGTYTIKLDNSACIRRCTIMEKNLSPTGTYPLPVTLLATAQAMIAAYHGTALTQIAADTRAEDLLILGFAQAYYSTGNERTYIRRMYGDNIAGILINDSFDIARIADCHFWPFPIAHKSFAASVWVRTGAAYKMTGHFDGGMISRCFEWAYDTGFDMQANNSIHMTDCSCDSGSLGTGQIGFKFTAATELVTMVDCKASGQDQGLYVNVTPAAGTGAIDVIGGAFFGNYAHIVSDNHRALTVLGVHLRDTNGGSRTGVTLNAGVTGSTNISENTFESMNNAYSIAAGVPAENCRRWNNTYKTATGAVLEDRMLADGTGNNSAYFTTYNASTGGTTHRHRHASGSVAAPGISPNNAAPYLVQGYAHDGSVFSPLGAMRIATHGSAPALGNTPGAVIFATNRSSNVLTDTFLVGEDGFVFPAADNSVKCGKSGLRWSEVWAANGAIQTSDERAKTDIEPSALGLAFIDSLRPVSYRWLVGGNRVTKTAESGEILETEPIPGVRTHWGLVAQEVKRAIDAAGVKDFAGWVLDDKDDPNSTQSLRYDQFIGPLVKAVQELSARLKDLEALVQP